MLRYSGLAIADYGYALKCLAYESLRLVQNSGNVVRVNPIDREFK